MPCYARSVWHTSLKGQTIRAAHLAADTYLAASKTRRAAQARLEPACARYRRWSTLRYRAQDRSAQPMTSCSAQVREQRRRSQRAQISERKSRPIASNGSLYSLPIPSACVVRAHRSCRDRSLHMVGGMPLACAAPGPDAEVQHQNPSAGCRCYCQSVR